MRSVFPSLFLGLYVFITPIYAQSLEDSIVKDSVEADVRWLASDQLKGRVNYSSEQIVAAQYLAKRFNDLHLTFFPGLHDYFMQFQPGRTRADLGKLLWNEKTLPDSLFYFFTPRNNKVTKNLNDFLVIRADLPLADNLLTNNWNNKEDILIWINLPSGNNFIEEILNLHVPEGWPLSDILIVGTSDYPQSLEFKGTASNVYRSLYNIVGVLPGKRLMDEMIVFSAHYDHVDRDILGRSGEIFNGANDDASGTAAVLALAKYYALRKDNDRTLVFCLFAGEELGLHGSAAFVDEFNVKNIKAVLNIEMIGKTNVTGNDRFFITGAERSSLSDIFTKNIKNERIKLFKYVDNSLLFMRSDNFNFFLKDIPAHSIMCSDDNDPCYHKPCDDADKIDYENMVEVIRAIAKSAVTLVNGKDTPVLK